MTVLAVFFALLLPETPRWLIMNGQRMRAHVTLQYLRGPKADVSSEMEEIELSLQNQELPFHWSMLKQPSVLKPSVITCMILFLQQYFGMTTILSYASIIVNSTHPSKVLLVHEPSILTVPGLIAVFLAFILVDRLGRRVLLLTSSALITLSLTGLAVFYKIKLIAVRMRIAYQMVIVHVTHS
jgi:hypothetical protein